MCTVIGHSTHISGLQVPAFIYVSKSEMAQAAVDVSVEMERTLKGMFCKCFVAIHFNRLTYSLAVRSFCFCNLELVCVHL